MIRHFVNSSDLYSVGYSDSVLEIQFRSGGIYQYFNVPERIYIGLLNATSHGQYFHRNIKNSYAYRKIA